MEFPFKNVLSYHIYKQTFLSPIQIQLTKILKIGVLSKSSLNKSDVSSEAHSSERNVNKDFHTKLSTSFMSIPVVYTF